MVVELSLLKKILLMINLKIKEYYKLLCLVVKNIGHMQIKVNLMILSNKLTNLELNLWL